MRVEHAFDISVFQKNCNKMDMSKMLQFALQPVDFTVFTGPYDSCTVTKWTVVTPGVGRAVRVLSG
jgi:hypothetical protein